MKLSRITLVVAIAFVAILALTNSVSAYTSAELSNYITGTHLINGSQYKLTDAQAANVKAYLDSNPVTDAQAAQIKAKLDEAKSKANATTDLSQMSDANKAEIVSLLQDAGAIAGVTVSVNTQNNTLTVSDGNTVLLNGSYATAGNGGLTVKFGNAGGTTSGAAAATGSSAGTTTASNGGASTFVYTGANNSIFAVIAVLAVVAVSTVSVKKVYAK